MNLLHTGAKNWTTKIHLNLMSQTAQQHSMQFRYLKQDDYKKKITMFHESVNDYKTNSWQQKGSSLHPSTQVNQDVKTRRITLRCWSKDRMQGDMPHTSSSSSTSWQDFTWQWKSWWWHSSQFNFLSVHSDCRNAVPTISRNECTQSTPPQRAWRTTQPVHKHARMWMRACGSRHDGWVVSSLCALKIHL